MTSKTLPCPVYYECGICDCIHPWDFNGDCRDDSNRLDLDDIPLCAEIGPWETRLMADREDCQ